MNRFRATVEINAENESAAVELLEEYNGIAVVDGPTDQGPVDDEEDENEEEASA